MSNRDQRPLLFVENCQADVAAGQDALGRLWVRLRDLCYRPAITLDDVDALMAEMRDVEAGLAAGRRVLQAERERTA